MSTARTMQFITPTTWFCCLFTRVVGVYYMSLTHKQEDVLGRRKNESHSRLQRLSERHYLQFSFTIVVCCTGSSGETARVNQRETVCDINSNYCKGHSSVYYSFHCWKTRTRQTSSNIYTRCCLIVKTHHLAEHQLFPPANSIVTDLVWAHFCLCTVFKKTNKKRSLVAFFQAIHLLPCRAKSFLFLQASSSLIFHSGAQGKHALITMFTQGWSDKEFHIIRPSSQYVGTR